MTQCLLASIFALGFLHMLMVLALCATRLPAMARERMSPKASTRPGALDTLPAWARNAANNYNNLSEAPTVFYAVVLAIAVLGRADGAYAILAWAYVALRYVHSALQATINPVIWRFAVFSLSWLVLGILVIRALLGCLG